MLARCSVECTCSLHGGGVAATVQRLPATIEKSGRKRQAAMVSSPVMIPSHAGVLPAALRSSAGIKLCQVSTAAAAVSSPRGSRPSGLHQVARERNRATDDAFTARQRPRWLGDRAALCSRSGARLRRVSASRHGSTLRRIARDVYQVQRAHLTCLLVHGPCSLFGSVMRAKPVALTLPIEPGREAACCSTFVAENSAVQLWRGRRNVSWSGRRGGVAVGVSRRAVRKQLLGGYDARVAVVEQHPVR